MTHHSPGVSASSRWSPVPDIRRLFRAGPYRFEFGIRPAIGSWFRLADPALPELAERRRLLRDAPERHAPWRTEAGPVMDGLLRLFPEPPAEALVGGGAEAARALAGQWEADFVLLRRDANGEFRMVGGCVCDPSAWDPAGKLGRTVAEIHSPVPTLNAAMGGRIGRFLDRLPPDITFTRENWGLAAVPDRNLHPSLGIPRMSPGLDWRSVWLRVEHQAFRALPGVDGIVFVIWLTVHRLGESLEDPAAAGAFCELLETMPDSVAQYKGLAGPRNGWVGSIRGSIGGGRSG